LIYVTSLNIPRRPPSLNDITRKYRSRRWGYVTIKRIWRKEFAPCPRQLRAKAEVRRRVRFTRWLGPRERIYDDDNYIGGLKPIRDILVELGYLVDDTETCAEFEYHQRSEVRRYGSNLVINIEEFGNRPEPPRMACRGR